MAGAAASKLAMRIVTLVIIWISPLARHRRPRIGRERNPEGSFLGPLPNPMCFFTHSGREAWSQCSLVTCRGDQNERLGALFRLWPAPQPMAHFWDSSMGGRLAAAGRICA